MQKYLSGINWELFDSINDIYVTDHHIKGWRYFATYRNGKSEKQTIFKKLAENGMVEVSGEWDWHHVVEGNHLAPLFSSSDFDRFYNSEWPTVLMHSNEEHKILNSLLRSSGTLLGLNISSTNFDNRNERDLYIRGLNQRYQDIYIGDPILRKIAHNLISTLT